MKISLKNTIYSTLLIFILSACSHVKLVGPYDEIVDNTVNQLHADTTAHFSKILSNKGKNDGSYETLKEFYMNVQGKVDTLIVRASVLEKGLSKTPLTKNFKMLKEQYKDLAEIHQTPFNEGVINSAKKAFDQPYRSIIKHIVYLKWNQKQPE